MAKSFKIFLVTGILLVLGGLAAPLQAQNRTVSGVVRDDTGEPFVRRVCRAAGDGERYLDGF